MRSQKIACGSEVCAAKSCFACAIDRGFVAADGRGLAARSQKIVCGFEVCAAKSRIRGLRSKPSDPRFACAILGLLRKSSDPRFAQQNPRMVRIRTLRKHIYHLGSALEHSRTS